jgi:hypothetical protein
VLDATPTRRRSRTGEPVDRHARGPAMTVLGCGVVLSEPAPLWGLPCLDALDLPVSRSRHLPASRLPGDPPLMVAGALDQPTHADAVNGRAP